MATHRCFFSGCGGTPECFCACSSPETFMCKLHMGFHWTSTANHSFKPIFSVPNPDTKTLLLSKLNKEKHKVEILKSKILGKFLIGHNYLHNLMIDIFKMINKDEKVINDSITKIKNAKEISKHEPNKLLRSLLLRVEDVEKKIDLPKFEANPNINAACTMMKNVLSIFGRLSKKLQGPFDGDIMQEFRDVLSESEDDSLSRDEEKLMIQQLSSRFDKLLTYEETIKKLKENYILHFELPKNLPNLKFLIKQCSPDINKENYKALIEVNDNAKELYKRLEKQYNSIVEDLTKMTDQLHFDSSYLYCFKKDKISQKKMLIIYNIEYKTFDSRNLNTQILDKGTSIIQLPNTELFCYGNSQGTGYTCILNLKTLAIKALPEGSQWSSIGLVYYNQCVYAFGGCSNNQSWSAQASKFDLIENKWIKLPTLSVSYSCNCSCVVFDNNILICSEGKNDIVKYEINRNSYTVVAKIDSLNKGKKILIAADLKVFLLESKGHIYESKDGNYWEQIEGCVFGNPSSVFNVYSNKYESIFICLNSRQVHSYEFNLHKKRLTKIISI